MYDRHVMSLCLSRGVIESRMETVTQTTMAVEQFEKVEAPAKHSKSIAHRIIVWMLYLVSFGLLAWFFFDGYSYYSTPLAERVHHEDYRTLRSAGSQGLLFGYVGAGMMILMLIYSIGKRTALFGRAVHISRLLDIHIYLGIIGPLFVVLHTGFKIQGLVAVAFWSMVAVAISGFFGRYVYRQIPRNIKGMELSIKEILSEQDNLARELLTRFRLDKAAISKLSAITEHFVSKESGGILKTTINIFKEDLLVPLNKHRFRNEVKQALVLAPKELHELVDLSFARIRLDRRRRFMTQMQSLLHTWHVVHKPFAIIMYIIMFVHIGVAFWTGYGWIH
jgi:hypothetical protein